MVIVREYRVRRRIVNWLEVNCTTFMWLHGSYVFQPWHVAVFLVLRFAKKKKNKRCYQARTVGVRPVTIPLS